MLATTMAAHDRHEPAKTGFVVAIDGPAGAGKSTLAKAVAGEIGLPYLNTGLMYRSLGDRALARSVDPDDEARLARLASEIAFSMSPGKDGSLLIDGAPPSASLESLGVEAVVSRIARHPAVRAVLRRAQRSLGAAGCVMEGRDIGSVVFPDADVKIFLSADADVRAGRRESERGEGGSVAARDLLDSRTNPLRPAPDAHVLDSTSMDRKEVLAAALAVIRGRLAGEPTTEDGPARVAVIGRPNVGKSTLVNRLLGRRESIAHESSGVTRDRVEVTVQWGGRSFVVIDTGGIPARPRGVEGAVARQAERAADEADVTLLVVDSTSGILDEDERLARRLRKITKPVLLVANKVDGEAQEPLAAEFNALGLGEPLPVSALHGRGSGDLLDRILELIPARNDPHLEDEGRFCLVGRPNVGKSSLFNRILREERAVVHDEPGTTRDPVDVAVRMLGRTLRFVDTAGLRRPVKTEGVEYYGLVRSIRAITRAQVALLVIDASEGFTSEDKRVAARVIEAGRGLVAALNKWDLVPSEMRARRFEDLSNELRRFAGANALRTSALTGMGVGRVVPALLSVHSSWAKRVPTSEVNRILQEALASTPPPRRAGRIRYATQVSAGPPSLVLFGADDPGESYSRYLEGTLRRAFDLNGVPIRLTYRPGTARRGRKGER